jgi:hypothetical protein
MERNKLTIAILVSTYALIIIALYLSSDTILSTSTLKSPYSDSQNPTNPISKCWSPPIKSDVTKHFYWTVPADWPAGVYPLCEEWITVYYWNCTEAEGSWVPIYELLTDENGGITMDLIPGKYKFSWVGDPSCPCCHMDWEHTITCCLAPYGAELPENFVNKVKGGDKAFLFFNLRIDSRFTYQLGYGAVIQ